MIYKIDFNKRILVETLEAVMETPMTNDDSLHEAKAATKPNRPRKALIKLAGLTWKPKSKLWAASNVTFDEANLEAYSYGWWSFLKVINGKIVFNEYGYSNTTRKHQSKVRRALSELGIEIDLYIEAPNGLQDLESAINFYTNKIESLETAMIKGKAAKNAERKQSIEEYKNKIKQVNKLLKKVA